MKGKTRKQHIDRTGVSRQEAKKPEELQVDPAAVKIDANAVNVKPGLSVKDILDALPFYVMLVDEHHHILEANSVVQGKLGLKPEAIIGKYCPEVIHGLNEPWYACPLEEALEKGQAVEREALDRESGRWINSAIYPTRRFTRDGGRIFFHMVSDITDHKVAEEQLKASHEQLHELLQYRESVREEERTNIAREVHDELGQILTGLKIDLSWLIKRLPQESEPLFDKAKSMYELLDTAIQTVKRISVELRPAVIDDLGLPAAIEWLIQEFGKRVETKFKFTSSPKDIILDRDRSTAIFRICQEVLTNVLRHADATRVSVSLKREPSRVVLRISDNGKGIEDKQISDPKAFGLIGMRERARFWNGDVNISGSPGRGTVVLVTIPLAGKEN